MNTKPPRKKINYQAALRDIANSMARLQRPERLLKMITRYLSREMDLSHTSLLVLDPAGKRFVFADSKGPGRLPVRLMRIDQDHPLISWFQQYRRRSSHPEYLSRERLEKELSLRGGKKVAAEEMDKLRKVLRTLQDFKVELALPGYHKDTLIGLLLIGRKKDGKGFSSSEISFFQILAHDCSMAVKSAEYHQHLMRQNQELERRIREIETLRQKEQATYYEIMRSLAQEVHAKDAYTFGHVSQVERLGMMTGQELGMDLSGRRRDILSASLILHDLGKIGIPDSILKKPAALNEEEWQVMRTHPAKGAVILSHLTDFREVSEIVHSHHENYDGSGYPRGLKGDQIPIEARIVSVVDAFHAIVSTRCYRKGRPVEVAFDELTRCSGKQFDPQVVESFLRALKREMKKRGVGFFSDEAFAETAGEAQAVA